MTNKQTVQVIQKGFIDNIKAHLVNHSIETLEFLSPFRIWVAETMFDDETRVPYVAVGLLNDGTVVGGSEIDEQEFSLEELDIYELAHILDTIDSRKYKIHETTE